MSAQVAVITGGGRGIGRATALRFSKGGFDVVVASRTMAELAETKAQVEAAGGRCLTVPTDVARLEEVEVLVREAVSAWGRIDVLVNCAGVAPLGMIDDLSPEVFATIWAVNVCGVYHACRAVWPVMLEQGGGTIVNISSVASVDAFPGFGAYGASKAWINAWTQSLAGEGRKCGIRVFAVAPGAVRTRMLLSAFPEFPADQMLQPEDVAEMIHVLSAPACRYASGQTVFVRTQG